MMRRRSGTPVARVCRGSSLVELMIGSTLGLVIVAATCALAAGQLADQRRLWLETQMQQDLRAALDLVVRDLRRALYRRDASPLVAVAGSPAVDAGPFESPAVTGTPGAQQVRYDYERGTGATRFGFKVEGGVLRSLQDGGGWQELTDAAVLRITSFTVDVDRPDDAAVPANAPTQVLPCPRLCSDGTASCWPTARMRQLVVTLTAEAVADPAFVRTVRAGVRLRNAGLDLDPGLRAAQRSCPE
jgi:type II secretory pathway component PulJ